MPVRCGEFFPCKEEMLDLLPGSEKYAHLFEMPPDAITNTCETLRIFSPRGNSWEFPFKAHVLDRVVLEQRMAKEAGNLGAEIRLGRPVRLYEDGGEIRVGATEQDSFNAEVVIAADGFPSTAAK